MRSGIGVVFDCDGTLVDSMAQWHGLDDRLACRAGVELTQDDRDFMTAATLYESSRYLHEKYGFGESPEHVVSIIYDDMDDFYANHAEAKPGALEFVRGLHELGVPMGVASSTSPKLLAKAVERSGFAPYMRTVVSVEDVNSSKRSPLVFDTVRNTLGTEASATWGAEDALYAIRTLNGAGYRTLGVFDSEIAGSAPDLRREADAFIMTFEALSAKEFVEMAEGISDDRNR